jgi:hypothetical protein
MENDHQKDTWQRCESAAGGKQVVRETGAHTLWSLQETNLPCDRYGVTITKDNRE